MSDDRELFDALRAAGAVPPPPDRERAYERAMAAIADPKPPRSWKPVVLLVAATLVALPSAVVAVRSQHEDAPQRPSFTTTDPTASPSADARDDDDRSGRRGGDDVDDDRSGRRGGDDDDDDRSGRRGGDDDERDDDSSGPGSGDGDEEDDDDSSGPGPGDDDEPDDD